jgi:hypothetical protein
MSSTILIDLLFVLFLCANTCTCLSFCNNGTVYVDVDGTVTPVDTIGNITCTSQCVVNEIKKSFSIFIKRFVI